MHNCSKSFSAIRFSMFSYSFQSTEGTGQP
uniref:Uncharacterized protein n=1 Tax=Tetranychus urticae TaxID=32264 RepID=T1KRJ1_TETUR